MLLFHVFHEIVDQPDFKFGSGLLFLHDGVQVPLRLTLGEEVMNVDTEPYSGLACYSISSIACILSQSNLIMSGL